MQFVKSCYWLDYVFTIRSPECSFFSQNIHNRKQFFLWEKHCILKWIIRNTISTFNKYSVYKNSSEKFVDFHRGEIEESSVLPSIVKNKLRPLLHLQLQNPASGCTFVLSANLVPYDHKTLLWQSPPLMRWLLSNISRKGQTCVLVS